MNTAISYHNMNMNDFNYTSKSMQSHIGRPSNNVSKSTPVGPLSLPLPIPLTVPLPSPSSVSMVDQNNTNLQVSSLSVLNSAKPKVQLPKFNDVFNSNNNLPSSRPSSPQEQVLQQQKLKQPMMAYHNPVPVSHQPQLSVERSNSPSQYSYTPASYSARVTGHSYSPPLYQITTPNLSNGNTERPNSPFVFQNQDQPAHPSLPQVQNMQSTSSTSLSLPVTPGASTPYMSSHPVNIQQMPQHYQTSNGRLTPVVVNSPQMVPSDSNNSIINSTARNYSPPSSPLVTNGSSPAVSKYLGHPIQLQQSTSLSTQPLGISSISASQQRHSSHPTKSVSTPDLEQQQILTHAQTQYYYPTSSNPYLSQGFVVRQGPPPQQPYHMVSPQQQQQQCNTQGPMDQGAAPYAQLQQHQMHPQMISHGYQVQQMGSRPSQQAGPSQLTIHHHPVKTASAWSPEDDKLLRMLKEDKKLGWREISFHFPTRTLNACQFRWRRIVIGVASDNSKTSNKSKSGQSDSRSNSNATYASSSTSNACSPASSRDYEEESGNHERAFSDSDGPVAKARKLSDSLSPSSVRPVESVEPVGSPIETKTENVAVDSDSVPTARSKKRSLDDLLN